MFVLVNRIRKMLKFEPGKDRVNFFFLLSQAWDKDCKDQQCQQCHVSR